MKNNVNEIDSFKYRWEFVRKNHNYQKDYDIYAKTKSKNKITEAIIQKYGIRPFNYRKSYEELKKNKRKYTTPSECDKKAKQAFQDLYESFLFCVEDRDKLVQTDAYSTDSLKIKKVENIKYKPIPFRNETELKKLKTLRLSLNMYYSKAKLLSKIDIL